MRSVVRSVSSRSRCKPVCLTILLRFHYPAVQAAESSGIMERHAEACSDRDPPASDVPHLGTLPLSFPVAMW